MEFILANNPSEYQIHSYQAGELVINQQTYCHSVLVSNRHLSLWRPQTLADIQLDDLLALQALSADVILLGVGEVMRFLSPELQHCIIEQRLPLETMTTSAACRTFQVLSSEQRLVYAALLV